MNMFEAAEVVDSIKAKQAMAEGRRQQGLVRRFSEFLTTESLGEGGQHAEEAWKALEETGSKREALAYLSSEIDKAVEQGNEVRRGELMRWKVSLSSRSNLLS